MEDAKLGCGVLPMTASEAAHSERGRAPVGVKKPDADVNWDARRTMAAAGEAPTPASRVIESITIYGTRHFDVRVWRDETERRLHGPDGNVVSLCDALVDCTDMRALGAALEAIGRVNAYEVLQRAHPAEIRSSPRGGLVVYPRWP